MWKSRRSCSTGHLREGTPAAIRSTDQNQDSKDLISTFYPISGRTIKDREGNQVRASPTFSSERRD